MSVTPPSDLRVAVVVARFNELLTERLLTGAQRTLAAAGLSDQQIDVHWVPGAFELPLAAQALARKGCYGAIVALGAVVRGSTPHFDYVCSTAAAGLARVSESAHIPLGFGLLTLDNLEQGLDRVGGKLGNKGAEAAEAALEMVALLAAIESD